MHNMLKTMKSDLYKTMEQVAGKMGEGKPMETSKMHVVNELVDSVYKLEILCLLHKLMEDPEKMGEKLTHAIGMMTGKDGGKGMQRMMNAIGLPHIGFDTAGSIPGMTPPYGDHYPMEDRRGYRHHGEMGGEGMEDRFTDRRGRPHYDNGRFAPRRTRSELDGDGMNGAYDNYGDGANMAGGQGGTSGNTGSVGGGQGGSSGRR